MNSQSQIIPYRKLAIIVLFTIIVIVITFYAVLPLILKHLEIDRIEIDSLLSTIISVSTAVYISIIVYIYAKKHERFRKQYLINQIVDYFALLKQGYGNDISSRQRNPDGSASELRINESFFNQKNMVALHIFDSVNELGDKVNSELAEFIKSVALHALGLPEIKKNTKGEYLEPDYSQYRVFVKGMDVVLEFLNGVREDYNAISVERKKIEEIQNDTQT